MNPQPAPLAYRIKGIPLVAAQYFPLFTDKKTLSRQPPRRDFTLQERTVIQRAEAYPYTVLLGGDTRKPTPGSIARASSFVTSPIGSNMRCKMSCFNPHKKKVWSLSLSDAGAI